MLVKLAEALKPTDAALSSIKFQSTPIDFPNQRLKCDEEPVLPIPDSYLLTHLGSSPACRSEHESDPHGSCRYRGTQPDAVVAPLIISVALA